MSWLQHQTKTLFGGSPQASVRLAQNVGTSATVAFYLAPPNPPTSQQFTVVMYNSIAGLILTDMKPCSQCLQTAWWRCHVGDKPELYYIEYHTFEAMCHWGWLCQVTLGKQSSRYPLGKTSGFSIWTASLSWESTLEGLLCFKSVPFVPGKNGPDDFLRQLQFHAKR